VMVDYGLDLFDTRFVPATLSVSDEERVRNRNGDEDNRMLFVEEENEREMKWLTRILVGKSNKISSSSIIREHFQVKGRGTEREEGKEKIVSIRGKSFRIIPEYLQTRRESYNSFCDLFLKDKITSQWYDNHMIEKVCPRFDVEICVNDANGKVISRPWLLLKVAGKNGGGDIKQWETRMADVRELLYMTYDIANNQPVESAERPSSLQQQEFYDFLSEFDRTWQMDGNSTTASSVKGSMSQ